MDRRALLMAAGVTAVLPSFAAAETDEEVDFLFVQAAAKISLKDGLLRLETANPHTLYFSDRPDKISGILPTKDFVEHWDEGTDNFQEEPPNAVLVLHQDDKPHVSVVVLRDPVYADGNLTYKVEVTDGQKEIEGGWSTLFIDLIGRPLTPLSFAGVRRRTRRRVMWAR